MTSTEDSYSGTAQQTALDEVTGTHGHSNVTCLASRGSGDLNKTLLIVGIIFFVGWIELLNIVLFEDISNQLLGLDQEFDVLILGLLFLCKLFAVGDAVSYFEKLLGDLGYCECFAFLYLSML